MGAKRSLRRVSASPFSHVGRLERLEPVRLDLHALGLGQPRGRRVYAALPDRVLLLKQRAGARGDCADGGSGGEDRAQVVDVGVLVLRGAVKAFDFAGPGAPRDVAGGRGRA